ncbi:hypothetical protein [Priestia aryabhattai]|uniref:hypothetical protein n=1 Tax=Priestia aryabhattai TaxID=412384 RepID=UPI003CFA5AF3
MSNQIKINKIVIEGDRYRRTFNFSKGLNVIKGEFYSGKSLLLNLINYSFGRNEKFKAKVQKELKEYCNKVYMEIEINSKIYTIRRNLWQSTETVFIFFSEFINKENYSPRTVNLSDFYKFLLECINIPEFNLLKHKKHSLEKEPEKISFRDLMRYIYIDQHDLGTPNFMKLSDYSIRKKNHYLFEIIHQFIEFDGKNLALKIANLTNEKEKIKRQADGLKSYLEELGSLSIEELKENFKTFNDKIVAYQKHKGKVIQSASIKKSNNELIYLKIKKKVIELSNEKTIWLEKQKDRQLAVDSKKKLLKEYEDELVEFKATKEALEILTIDEHPHSCPLCSSLLEGYSTDNYKRETIEDVIDQTNKKIDTLLISKDTSIKKVNEIEQKIQLINEEYMIYEKALKEYENEIDAPYIADIELINNVIKQLSNEKENINEKIKLHNKITEKKSRIFEIEKNIRELEVERDALKLEESEKEKTFTLLNQEYQKIMKSLHINVDEVNCFIDKNKYLPVYNGANLIEHDSGGVLVCMQIAFLAAIMKVSKTSKRFKHPGFLMLDTVGKYLGTTLQGTDIEVKEDQIMDPVTYKEIYKLLIELGKEFQIFIVDNIPHEIAEEFVEYTFYHNDLRGLIDKKKNEYISGV